MYYQKTKVKCEEMLSPDCKYNTTSLESFYIAEPERFTMMIDRKCLFIFLFFVLDFE